MPGLAHILASFTFIGGMAYFLRPRVQVTYNDNPQAPFVWGGRGVQSIRIDYPDAFMARNTAVVMSVVLTRNADVGGILAFGGTALMFSQLITIVFTPQDIPAYDLAFGPESGNVFNAKKVPGPVEVRTSTYTRIILKRVLFGLFVAALFFMILKMSALGQSLF
jgi:hypothetical protein